MEIPTSTPPQQRVVPRHRPHVSITVILLLLAALAWAATILWSRSSSAMDSMPGNTTLRAAGLFSVMWVLMMAAMMFPAVSPVVTLFRTVQRQKAVRGDPRAVAPAIFVGGYLAVWLLAGLGAFALYAGVQSAAQHANLSTDVLPYAGGAIVVLAGLYQFSPLKNACLRKCRSPLGFIMKYWTEGRAGALRMGAQHGMFCLGCCAGIMAVLFVVGLMSLGWMAVLSLIIIAEKLTPRGFAIGRMVGLLFIALGLLIAFKALPADGLTTGGGMQGMAMSSGATPSQHQGYQATAGSYHLTLSIGPAEMMLTRAEARRTHARLGEVMLDPMAMSQGMPMGAMSRHVELHVTDSMGMAVTNAHVTMSLRSGHGPARSLMVARMFGVREGIKDLHYGANADLAPGAYTVRIDVNGAKTSIPVHVSS